MTTLRVFTSALILAALVSGPAHAEMVSATKPASKTAEAGRAKRDAKGHGDKNKHASVEKKKAHDDGKASKTREKPKAHAGAKTAHTPSKDEQKHAAAKAKANANANARPTAAAHKAPRPDKRIASRDKENKQDKQKERHGSH
jgi:hypothetical protein